MKSRIRWDAIFQEVCRVDALFFIIIKQPKIKQLIFYFMTWSRGIASFSHDILRNYVFVRLLRREYLYFLYFVVIGNAMCIFIFNLVLILFLTFSPNENQTIRLFEFEEV